LLEAEILRRDSAGRSRHEKSPADLRLARPSFFFSSLFHMREAERREAFLGFIA
jgi:hypothetical protein